MKEQISRRAFVEQTGMAAIPVAQLHKKIGMLELKSFEFVTDDFAVQKTVFSDGTQIVANISDADKMTEKYGMIKADSWQKKYKGGTIL